MTTEREKLANKIADIFGLEDSPEGWPYYLLTRNEKDEVVETVNYSEEVLELADYILANYTPKPAVPEDGELRKILTNRMSLLQVEDHHINGMSKGDEIRLEHYVDEVMQLFASQAAAAQERAYEAGAIELRDRLSTGGRPLSAPPLIIKQPVPCPRCGDEEYADWTLYPHQLYNSYMPGGTGHYCFPCFAAIVAAQPKQQDGGVDVAVS